MNRIGNFGIIYIHCPKKEFCHQHSTMKAIFHGLGTRIVMVLICLYILKNYIDPQARKWSKTYFTCCKPTNSRWKYFDSQLAWPKSCLQLNESLYNYAEVFDTSYYMCKKRLKRLPNSYEVVRRNNGYPINC